MFIGTFTTYSSTNFLSEVQGHEAEMCGDADGSRILEVLLMVSNDFHIRVFFTAIRPSIEALSCNQFASHVIETLLVLSADVCHRELLGTSVVETDIQLQTIQELILATCDVGIFIFI
jgi:nucleolar protein 9